MLEELIVSALLELEEEEVVDVELDEEELSEPPNMLAEADIAPREDPRLPP